MLVAAAGARRGAQGRECGEFNSEEVMQNTGQVQKWVQRNASVAIPKGGSFRLMVDLAPKKRGVSIVEMSTLLVFDKDGNLYRQCDKTRPRAKARFRNRMMELPVRRCVLQETSTQSKNKRSAADEKRRQEAEERREGWRSGCGPATLAARSRQSSPKGDVAATTSAAAGVAVSDDRPPVVWRRFLASIGVSVQTGWRWRQLGIIKTHDLAGKPYVAAAEIDRFNRRLASGELSGIRRTGAVRAASKRRSEQ